MGAAVPKTLLLIELGRYRRAALRLTAAEVFRTGDLLGFFMGAAELKTLLLIELGRCRQTAGRLTATESLLGAAEPKALNKVLRCS